MPIDPTARLIIDAMEKAFPPLDPTLSGTETRRRVEEAAKKVMPAATNRELVGEVVDRTVDGPAGEIPIRIYRPSASSVARPVSSPSSVTVQAETSLLQWV